MVCKSWRLTCLSQLCHFASTVRPPYLAAVHSLLHTLFFVSVIKNFFIVVNRYYKWKKTDVAYARFWMFFSGLFMAVTLLKCGWIFLHFGTCKTYSGKKLKYICITEYVSQCGKQWSYVGNLYGCDLEILLICIVDNNTSVCLHACIKYLGTRLLNCMVSVEYSGRYSQPKFY